MRNGPYELVIAPAEYPGKKYRDRYVYEHHLVWWKATGEVPDYQVGNIHHKNGDKRDNRVENLERISRSRHSVLHAKGPTSAHGDYSRWARHKCRCAVCVDGMREYRRKYPRKSRRKFDAT